MTEAQGQLVTRLLRGQAAGRAVSIVTLDSGSDCVVYSVAVGRDMDEGFDNYTTEPAPPGESKYVEFFHANEVVRIVDQATGMVLFAV